MAVAAATAGREQQNTPRIRKTTLMAVSRLRVFETDLPSYADNDSLVALLAVDVKNALAAELLEVQLVALVVVRGHSLGVVVNLKSVRRKNGCII